MNINYPIEVKNLLIRRPGIKILELDYYGNIIEVNFISENGLTRKLHLSRTEKRMSDSEGCG